MDLALESYDMCTGLLQSKPKSHEGKHYTISLPNLHVDAAISVEEVRKHCSALGFKTYQIKTVLTRTKTASVHSSSRRGRRWV